MKRYLITGGTGMVGSHLVNEIKQTDAHITILTRQDKTLIIPKSRISTGQRGWQHQVPDIDIVINLAGATLNKRWTSSHKQAMMLSRIQSTQTLFELLKHVNTNQKFYLTQVQWATTLRFIYKLYGIISNTSI